MNIFQNSALIAALFTFFCANANILMPYIPSENSKGNGGIDCFNCTWQPLFETIEIPSLKHHYEIIDIPDGMHARTHLRNCHRHGVVNVNDFPNRKKVTIVHEIMNWTEDTLRNSDYLIYMNEYQRDIAEKILGVIKPCCVLPCHPIPFHLTAHLINKPRKHRVYLGGHFLPDKTHDLVERLEKLIQRLDADEESAGATLACYFVVAFADLVDTYNRFKANVISHPLLKDRVEIHDAHNIPYLTMFENMAACKYTYVWRNEQSLGRLKYLIEKRDASILYHSVGESSIFANAVAAGCIPIVENTYRFRAYFETDLSYSFEDFVKQLAEFIIKIDNDALE